MADITKQSQGSKMGCSLLRQCRRRTQSEPPRKYKPGKTKLKDISRQHKSYDEINKPISEKFNRQCNKHLLSNSSLTVPKFDTRNIEVEESCELCDKERENEPRLHQSTTFSQNECHIEKCENALNQQNVLSKTLSLDFQKHATTMESSSNDNIENYSCFPKIGCCRKTKRKERNSNSNNNNNTRNTRNTKSNCNRITYEDYTKLSQTSSLNSSVCTGSLLTASSCLTTSSCDASTLLSDQSSMSQDSGFDEPPCFLNIIFHNHKCKGMHSCKKKNYISLNLHLKALMNCMPKSFSESEAIQNQLANCSGVQRDPYLAKRRNAICETSEEMRSNFNEALCAFLTLQAMAKYEFL